MLQRAAIPSQNILRLTLCLCHGTLFGVFHVAPATIVQSESLIRLAIDLVGPANRYVVPSTGAACLRFAQAQCAAGWQFQLR
jgi:hypothetical protein